MQTYIACFSVQRSPESQPPTRLSTLPRLRLRPQVQSTATAVCNGCSGPGLRLLPGCGDWVRRGKLCTRSGYVRQTSRRSNFFIVMNTVSVTSVVVWRELVGAEIFEGNWCLLHFGIA